MLIETGTKGQAVFSACKRYRYLLTRPFNLSKPRAELRSVNFVMLNPSTATQDINDPTITRCICFAQDWGFEQLFITNIFALRSTDPAALYSEPDPIGEANNRYLLETAKISQLVVCAWGSHGALRHRGSEVKGVLCGVCAPHFLQMTKTGHPGHPLYLKKTLKALPFSAVPI